MKITQKKPASKTHCTNIIARFLTQKAQRGTREARNYTTVVCLRLLPYGGYRHRWLLGQRWQLHWKVHMISHHAEQQAAALLNSCRSNRSHLNSVEKAWHLWYFINPLPYAALDKRLKTSYCFWHAQTLVSHWCSTVIFILFGLLISACTTHFCVWSSSRSAERAEVPFLLTGGATGSGL